MSNMECVQLSVPATTSPILYASETQSYAEADSQIETRTLNLFRFVLRLVLRMFIPYSMFMQRRSISLLSTVLTYATPVGKRQRQRLSSFIVGSADSLKAGCVMSGSFQKGGSGLIESVCSLCVPNKMGKVRQAVDCVLQPIQRVFSVVTDESGDASDANAGYDLIVVQSTLSQCLSLSDMCIIPLDDQSMSVCSSSGDGRAKLWPIRIVIWLWIMIYSWCNVVLKLFQGALGGSKAIGNEVCVTGGAKTDENDCERNVAGV